MTFVSEGGFKITHNLELNFSWKGYLKQFYPPHPFIIPLLRSAVNIKAWFTFISLLIRKIAIEKSGILTWRGGVTRCQHPWWLQCPKSGVRKLRKPHEKLSLFWFWGDWEKGAWSIIDFPVAAATLNFGLSCVSQGHSLISANSLLLLY